MHSGSDKTLLPIFFLELPSPLQCCMFIAHVVNRCLYVFASIITCPFLSSVFIAHVMLVICVLHL